MRRSGCRCHCRLMNTPVCLLLLLILLSRCLLALACFLGENILCRAVIRHASRACLSQRCCHAANHKP
jgi:hypothetical protein